MKKIIWWSVIGIVGVLFLFIILPHWVKKVKEKEKPIVVKIYEILNYEKVKAYGEAEILQLRWEVELPASVEFNYAYSMETQGKKIKMKFPGVDKWIFFRGTGRTREMEELDRWKGQVLIESNE